MPAADELRTRAGSVDRRLPNRLDRQTQRHGHVLEVHADHGIADIETGVGLDELDCDRVIHRLIDRRRERAAGFRPRADAYDLVSEPLRVGALHNQGAVEVLAALRLQAEAARFQDRQDLIDHGFCRLGRRALADLLPHDLARGAADHDLLAGLERGNIQQLEQGCAGGFANLFIHEWSSPDSY